MRSVFIHPLAGVLSAYGIGLADTIVMRQETAELPLDADSLKTLEPRLAALELDARGELQQQGIASANIARSLLLKYAGTDSTLTLTLQETSTPESLAAVFLEQYRARYGFHVTGRAIEQAHLQAAFELRETRAGRRRRQAQLAPRGGQAAQLRGLDEEADIAEIVHRILAS